VRYPLDLDFLNEASQYLVGKQDFKSFQSAGTPVQTTVRTISQAVWTRSDEDTLEFTIRGDGFLKQMVRNIVGTLIDLNQEQERPEKFHEILGMLDRRKAGPTAPPEGLFLYRVNYPEAIDNKCRKL
jgi:tRNA pseudouridine38-40 synthase